ncbi:MAG: hypothetical protein KDI44_18910 [Thiothrix sp.]|nr:hypothetical protein [Thiothrix sp.]HPQ95018.1 hypothetical protein [Thiolinea sp.]
MPSHDRFRHRRLEITVNPVPDYLLNTTTRIQGKRRDLPASTSEKAIFYYLGIGHVFFNRDRRWLYFSDVKQTPVLAMLESLCRGQRHDVELETLYLDVHRCFFGGYRLRLPADLCHPLLVALRLKGVVISYDLAVAAPAAVPPAPDNPDG